MKREAVAGLLFPQKCVSCGIITGTNAPVCPECMRKIAYASGSCRSCGEACSFCTCYEITDVKYRFIPFFYKGGAVNRAILSMKKSDIAAWYAFFGEVIARYIKIVVNSEENGFPFEVITFVPRSERTKRETGLDQAQLLAQATAKALGVKSATLLLRMHSALPQKELRYTGRLENVKNLFAPMPQAAQYKSVLLVDDLITSGMTVSACAAALKTAGIKTVSAAAIAKTEYRPDKKVKTTE
ncbi:MAG TPA: hypothetical protein PLT66_03830 [Bacillota bacterium]|nr:hypothetical protein [Bacillota bacterium]